MRSDPDPPPPPKICTFCGQPTFEVGSPYLVDAVSEDPDGKPVVDEMCNECAGADGYTECPGCGSWFLEKLMSYELDDDQPYCKDCVIEAQP